jgi:hypothetical protein
MLRTFCESCFREEKKSDGVVGKCLDFEKIIPSPEIVKQTISGSCSNMGADLLRVLAGEEAYDERYDRKIGRQEGEEVNESIKRFFKENPKFEKYGRLQLQCLEETGFIDWYAWNTHHWGTKWNACEGEISYFTAHDGTAIMEFTFDTAWSVPKPIWDKLPGLFPDIVFKMFFFEEGWSFAGEGTFNKPDSSNGFVYYSPNPKGKAWRDLYEIVYGKPYQAWDGDDPETQEGE